MKRALICGAGIAGPSLAFWMSKPGWEVTVLEKAPVLRPGGQAVDFRGPVHREVLERMGLWGAIHERRTYATDVAMLRRDGSTFATLPKLMMGGDVEILRGDLAQLLYERTRERAHYLFGTHVTALEQTADDVRVQLSNGATETFDLVVGADGLHSAVRRLAFGDESRFVKHHGHRLATCALSDPLGLATRFLPLHGSGARPVAEHRAAGSTRAVYLRYPGRGRMPSAGTPPRCSSNCALHPTSTSTTSAASSSTAMWTGAWHCSETRRGEAPSVARELRSLSSVRTCWRASSRPAPCPLRTAHAPVRERVPERREARRRLLRAALDPSGCGRATRCTRCSRRGCSSAASKARHRCRDLPSS